MGRNLKVLVADDDPEVLLMTSEILSRAGYDVIQASTGKECLESAVSQHPDLVLLDVVLPDVTGMKVCRQIKTDPALRDIFVILVSGVRVSSDFQTDGLNVGADGYIVKPIPNRELVARVQSMERIKRAEQALLEREKEQTRLIEELKEALAEVKTLKGFIPICASCKKIRDDKGYWSQLEAYISEHTGAEFSHSLCPDCEKEFRSKYREAFRKDG
jgi:DNA-binding response OmpR family regulator